MIAKYQYHLYILRKPKYKFEPPWPDWCFMSSKYKLCLNDKVRQWLYNKVIFD